VSGQAAAAGPLTRRPPIKAFTVNRTANLPTVKEARAALAEYLVRAGVEGTILSHRRFTDGWSFLVEIRGAQ